MFGALSAEARRAVRIDCTRNKNESSVRAPIIVRGQVVGHVFTPVCVALNSIRRTDKGSACRYDVLVTNIA